MSVTPKQYQEAVKEALDSLDDIFDADQVEIKNKTKAVILRLLHEFGFDFIKK